MTGRVVDAMTAVAARTYPRSRRTDARVVRDWSVDFGVSSLLPTLLLVAGGLSLPRGRRPRARAVLAGLAAGLIPAAIAVVALLPYATPKPSVIYLDRGRDLAPIFREGPPYPFPWLPPSRSLTAILGLALALAIVVTWREARDRPERLPATGLVLASVAYPLTWVLTRTEELHIPWWLLNGGYPLLLTVVPALMALVLIRHAAGARSRSPEATPG